MRERAKERGFVILALSAALLAIALAGYGFWQREQAPKSDWDRRFGFPDDEGVIEVAVRPMADGEAWELETGRRKAGMEDAAILRDPAALAELTLLLHQAPRTGFGDPEPPAVLYVAAIRTEDGKTAQYAVADRRRNGDDGGSKIYPLPGKGRTEVWLLPPRALELLLGTARE